MLNVMRARGRCASCGRYPRGGHRRPTRGGTKAPLLAPPRRISLPCLQRSQGSPMCLRNAGTIHDRTAFPYKSPRDPRPRHPSSTQLRHNPQQDSDSISVSRATRGQPRRISLPCLPTLQGSSVYLRNAGTIHSRSAIPCKSAHRPEATSTILNTDCKTALPVRPPRACSPLRRQKPRVLMRTARRCPWPWPP